MGLPLLLFASRIWTTNGIYDTQMCLFIWHNQHFSTSCNQNINSSKKKKKTHHVYKDCILPLEKTALISSFSVSLTHLVSCCRLIHCPHLCSFSFALCIVWCPAGMPFSSSFLKGSKDLTLNSDFIELVHGVTSRHTAVYSVFLPSYYTSVRI